MGNLFSNIVANLFSSIILLVVGFFVGRWSDYTRKTRAFRRMFGKRAGKSGDLLIVLDTIRDTRLLPPSEQQKIGVSNPGTSHPFERFFKLFPDGHITAINGPTGSLVPECSARGAPTFLTLSEESAEFLQRRFLITQRVLAGTPRSLP